MMYTSLIWFLPFVVSVSSAAELADENGVCYKIAGLGNRPGNTYYCADPELPLCCQKDDAFNCCETNEQKNISDQAILWGFMCLIGVAFVVVFILLTKEGDFWESETVKIAAKRLMGNLAIKRKQQVEAKVGEDCDPDEKQVKKPSDSLSELQNMPLSWF